MPSQPRVSVVVPCYNHARYVQACIKSILNQTYKNIELIVIDDGSKDNSVDVIQQLANEHGFLFMVQSNQGLTKTLNIGLEKTSGKYVAFFASDDIMTLDRTEKQVAFMEQHPQFVACGGNYIAIDTQGNQLLKQVCRPYRELTFDDLFLNKKHGIPTITALIKKEAILKVGGYREDIAIEDEYMWLKLTSQVGPIAVLDEQMAFYRKHDSALHRNLELMLNSLLAIYQDYKNQPHYQEMINRIMRNYFLKASMRDKALAQKIKAQMNGGKSHIKYFKGLFNLYFR